MTPFLYCLLLINFQPKRELLGGYRPIPRVLHIASILSAAGDIAATQRLKSTTGVYEQDPLAKPIVNNAAYSVWAVAVVVGLNLAVDRMNTSPRLHKFAKPLLMIQIGGSTQGFIWTLHTLEKKP